MSSPLFISILLSVVTVTQFPNQRGKGHFCYRKRYHRLVRKLVRLVAASDGDSDEPVGDGWPRPCAWELDDLANTNPAVAEK